MRTSHIRVIALMIVTVVARFGLLATMAHQLFFFLAIMYPMTTDFSAWYAPSMVFALALAAGIAVYGFYTLLGGHRRLATGFCKSTKRSRYQPPHVVAQLIDQYPAVSHEAGKNRY